jgi:phospholipid/cholesterol/gamma-HCH transport system substrate-binding protein
VKKLRERNLVIIASIAAFVFLVGGFVALNFANWTKDRYSAYLQTAVGLQPGDVVTIAGVRVGSVTGLSLDHGMVKASFEIDGGHHLGSTTSATVKVLNPVGVEYVELNPSGPGRLSGPIPVDRTTVPQTLVSDLNTLASNTQQTNIAQLIKSLQVLTQTFGANTPAETGAALDGVAELSAVLGADQQNLENLINQSQKLTGLLNGQSSQLVQLIGQSSILLQVLNNRKADLDNLLATTTQLTDQIDHIIGTDRTQLDPLLANLKAVSAELASQSNNVGAAIPLLAAFSRYSANVTGSGPYADFVAPSLVIPDDLVAQCAAIGKLDPQRGCRP